MNALEQFLERYGLPAGATGPALFVEEVLGATVDPWQRDVLLAFGRGERRISIRACHGPGKTALAAWLVLYMLCCRFPQKTVATAPTRPQLEDALVSEVMSWYGRLPDMLRDLLEPKQNRIELKAAPDESFFSARTARAETPEALQGIHSQNVLLIGDEASAIPEPIFVAGQGSMSGHTATTLLLSNATRTSGYFYRTHNQLRHRWFTVKVAAADSPRVSPEFVREVAETWGEDSDEYRVRVLAEFPKQDTNTLIPIGVVESARALKIDVPDAREVWGVDVSRFGGDRTVVVRRSKVSVSPRIETWTKRDTMYSAGRVQTMWAELAPHLRPEDILVDDIGVGGGVVDRLQQLGLPARSINVGVTASLSDKYRNLRTELWFKCKEWLETNTHSLPKAECCGRSGKDVCVHDSLAEELVVARYGYTASNKIMLEPKDLIKKALGRSPDIADAVMLTFASEPATLLYGSSQAVGWSRGWNEPIKRGLSHV